MEYIRNVCILAHVDHGKTTLADNLLYSNGVISKHSAGDLRHLDSTQDEQERGITMKSSCISLKHLYKNKLKNDQENKSYIINLIDSPGHVDFSGEVSTAVKISDNAFVIVDVIEGVSSQTRTVIQQAWKERLNFILVLNKIDKMYLELKLDSSEAYRKLESIIQDVHHIIGELISMDVREEEEKTDTIFSAEYISQKYDTNPFNPLKGKVIFCSAFHQWGFRISDFVTTYSKLLEIDKLELFKKMWGDFYINSKKKITKGAAANDRKNIFTSLILDQIWNIYSAFGSNEIDKVTRMMAKLDISIELKKNTRGSSSQIENIRTVFRRWMPLPTVLFDTLVEKCPNPRDAINDEKLALLVPDEKFEKAKQILKEASTDKDAPTVVFISKFMFQSSSKNDLIGLGRIYSGQVRADLKMFVFAPKFNPFKVSKLFLDVNPNDFDEGPINVYEGDAGKTNYGDISVIRLENVYQFRGQDQVLLRDGAPAGHVVGFTGFDLSQTYKNATLVANCSLGNCLGMFTQHENHQNSDICNIICVSIQPENVVFLNELQEALHLLEKSDPIVNVSVSPTGELLVYAAGEIHLQKCLNELTTRIVPHIEIKVSSPIVPFRETVVHRAMCDVTLYQSIRDLSQELKTLINSNISTNDNDFSAFKDHQGVRESIVVYSRLQRTGTKLCCRLSIHSLPLALVNWIENNYAMFCQLHDAIKSGNQLSKSDIDHRNQMIGSLKISLENATKEEQEMCENTDVIPLDYSALMDQLCAIGNNHATQCNMLFSYVGLPGIFSLDNEHTHNHQQFGPFSQSIKKGFQKALKEGPICQEFMKNTAFIVHSIWESNDETVLEGCNQDKNDCSESASSSGASDVVNFDRGNSFSSLICNPGQVSGLVTKACQAALLYHPGARLMIAMYKLDLEVRITTYKQLSSIINQLHGNIVNQEVYLGNFIVEARIPVIESFGFGDKLRKKTSGEVGLPQLKTILWELLDCSPLLDMNIYKTIADRAENCDIGIFPELVARTQNYINTIRQRKGIHIWKQLIESGDKQRTLNKKK